jgi:rhamnosyltransferase
MQKNTVGVVIPIFNPDKRLFFLLDVLGKYDYKILIIDSSKTDTFKANNRNHNLEYIKIAQNEFNHGATREFARKQLGTNIAVMLTQDIIPANNDFIEKLVKPIVEGTAAVCYARQLPRKEANLLESFNRYYNYPEKSQFRTIEDTITYGVYTFFCSNSCSAYKNEILDEIGGFNATMTWEDYIAAAKILIKGYRIAYVAEAVVYHSHGYTPLQELNRYFDAGYIRKRNNWLNKYIASAEKRGIGYTKKLLSLIIKKDISLLPYMVVMVLIKFIGYRLGYHYNLLPKKIRIFLSEQKYFWNSKFNTDNVK